MELTRKRFDGSHTLPLNICFVFLVGKRDEILYCFFPTAESFGVSAQIGSGVVRGGPEVSSTRVPRARVSRGFHQGSTRVVQGSTRVPPGFHQGSTRVPPGFHRGSTRVPRGLCKGCGVVRALKRAPHAGISPELIF